MRQFRNLLSLRPVARPPARTQRRGHFGTFASFNLWPDGRPILANPIPFGFPSRRLRAPDLCLRGSHRSIRQDQNLAGQRARKHSSALAWGAAPSLFGNCLDVRFADHRRAMGDDWTGCPCTRLFRRLSHPNFDQATFGPCPIAEMSSFLTFSSSSSDIAPVPLVCPADIFRTPVCSTGLRCLTNVNAHAPETLGSGNYSKKTSLSSQRSLKANFGFRGAARRAEQVRQMAGLGQTETIIGQSRKPLSAARCRHCREQTLLSGRLGRRHSGRRRESAPADPVESDNHNLKTSQFYGDLRRRHF